MIMMRHHFNVYGLVDFRARILRLDSTVGRDHFGHRLELEHTIVMKPFTLGVYMLADQACSGWTP